MRADSSLEAIARRLADLRQSISEAGHEDWNETDASALLSRVGEIALYLEESEAIITGSRDDYATLIGLEIRQNIVTNAQTLVTELTGARSTQNGRGLAADVQKALIRAGDRCGRDLAALARAHIDAAGLIN
jgi:hypothetical protein